jgi:hypothetical protein
VVTIGCEILATGEDRGEVMLKSDSADCTRAWDLAAVGLRIFRAARPPTDLIADCCMVLTVLGYGRGICFAVESPSAYQQFVDQM